jgi:DNA topoisomerase-1
MAKWLVIVESPAKAKTINRFLGSDYLVRACMGHIRDLPKDRIGVDVEHDFAPTYLLLSSRRKVIGGLKKAAADAELVFLATDLDREGEAIAWHLMHALKLPPEKVRRVTFNEITKRAITNAFKNPGELSLDKFNAQQARRILDRIVGYKLSPLLWAKFKRGLSAGRVQSVATRLIVEREREIENFASQEYWVLKCLVHPEGREDEKFWVALKEREGEDWKPGSEEEANETLKNLKSSGMKVADYSAEEINHYSFPPLITSTMQQSASYELRFSAKKTMQIAQQLYEGVDLGEKGRRGIITYHRTDSVRVSWAAVGMVREYIGREYGDEYLPPKGRMHRQKPGAQAAHEAIRPTSTRYEPENIKDSLSRDQFKLYSLIWKRFVASQMTPAVYAQRDVQVAAGKYLLEGVSRTLVFDGHSRVSGFFKDIVEPVLPDMTVGEVLVLGDAEKEQKFTKPPARYTEGSLVRALEKEGIGRPSTYAAIISTIQNRDYVEKKRASFYATEVGKVVTDKLVEFFPKIMDVKFTSGIEEKLDQVEGAQTDWLDVLHAFYDTFQEHLEKAEKEMTPESPAAENGEVCEKCGRPMIIRFKGKDAFLGCSGYPECRNSRPVGGPREKKPVIETDIKCDKCGEPMVIRHGRFGRFIACSAFPKCRNTKPLDAAEGGAKTKKTGPKKKAARKKKPKAEPSGEVCEKCGMEMVWRKSRWGKFLACSGYPRCRNTRRVKEAGGDEEKATRAKKKKAPAKKKKKSSVEPSGETCEKCGSEMVWRKGRWGEFLACSSYPRCRNIRKGAKRK